MQKYIQKSNLNKGSYKFDLIIDYQFNSFYFQEDVAQKLYFELEILLKGSFIRNWDNFLKNVSFTSVDYDFLMNLKNKFGAYQKFNNDEVLNNLKKENSLMEIEQVSCKCNKEKQEFFEKHMKENYCLQSMKKNKFNTVLTPV